MKRIPLGPLYYEFSRHNEPRVSRSLRCNRGAQVLWRSFGLRERRWHDIDMADKEMGAACYFRKKEKVCIFCSLFLVAAELESIAFVVCCVRVCDRAPILDISVHPSGRALLSVAKDKRLKMWNLVDAQMIYKQKFDKEMQLVCWSPAGSHYALVSFKEVAIRDSVCAVLFATAT